MHYIDPRLDRAHVAVCYHNFLAKEPNFCHVGLGVNALHTARVLRRHRIRADVVGQFCESGDYLALDRDLAEPSPGDLVAVMSAGAYGAVQAGTYNTRALVPEVLVKGEEWALVRPRIEVETLIGLDSMPAWLASSSPAHKIP